MSQEKFQPRPSRRSALRIAVAADHAGYEIKSYLGRLLTREGVSFDDLGPHSDQRVDYPDFARRVAEAMGEGRYNAGVLCCGSGQGMVISANRYPGIRATLCFTPEQARLARLHNDSNVLVLGGRMISNVTAGRVVREWLDTRFEGGRHRRRLAMIDQDCGGAGTTGKGSRRAK